MTSPHDPYESMIRDDMAMLASRLGGGYSISAEMLQDAILCAQVLMDDPTNNYRVRRRARRVRDSLMGISKKHGGICGR